MEVTRAEAFISVSRYTVTARVCRSVTRVNTKQSSKRTMRRPTRQGLSGKADTAGANERNNTPSRCAGVVATACTQGKRTQHGKPQGVVRDDQPDAREGRAGRPGVAERFVVPLKPGNAGGGRAFSSRRTHYVAKNLEIGQPINSDWCSKAADGVARESKGVRSCPRAGCGRSACPVR